MNGIESKAEDNRLFSTEREGEFLQNDGIVLERSASLCRMLLK
jgi:hypothetical protein